MRAHIVLSAAVAALGSVAMWVSPVSHAEGGWVAVANSPGHEQQDWSIRADQASAESAALAQCAQLERASDCRILASGPDCVATAWDAAQPINQLHAASGGGPEVVVRAAILAAGPTANDPAVRCSWYA